MANAKAKAAVDEDEDLLDINEEDEEEEEPAPKRRVVVDTDDEDEEDDDLADEEEEEKPAARKPAPVAKAAKPIVVSPPPGEEDVSDADFDREAKKRRDQQKVDNYLERRRSEETVSVDEITELMMVGDSDKIMHELVKYCADNSGIKMAKQLLREARDRAKARVTRIAGMVSVMLDELKQESEDSSGGSRD